VPPDAELFLDARGDARALRVRWHQDEDVVVLSMWRGGQCVSTFRLAVDEVPDLIASLRAGLARAYTEAPRPELPDCATTR
jgi:hypothetical protein